MKKNIVLQVKNIVGKSKIKVGIYIIMVLWLSIGVQVITNKVIEPKKNILEAFVNTKSEISYITLEIAGVYGNGYLGENDKKELIYTIADEIGLQIDDSILSNTKGEDSELYYQKTGKNADTLIKIYSRPTMISDNTQKQENYVFVRLKVLTNPQSSLEFRKVLEDIYKKMKIEKTFVTMEVSSTYLGKLSLDEMNQIADGMLKNLSGKAAYEHRVEDLYTIYGYTGLLSEYIVEAGNKINIHVAITYDEEEDKTKVILATPVINGVY